MLKSCVFLFRDDPDVSLRHVTSVAVVESVIDGSGNAYFYGLDNF